MTSDLMKDWLLVVWNRRPRALLRKGGMLVLDAFKGRLSPEIKATITDGSINTDLVVIPGGMTSQLQVLDVVVNRPFKDHLKQLYSEWLLSGDHALTPAGRIKKPSVTILCHWIITAWQPISPELIVKGFKKCCISNAMDGSEDDVLWNDSEENGDVRSDAEEEEGTDREDADSDTDWERQIGSDMLCVFSV
jgi:hypothetical protein